MGDVPPFCEHADRATERLLHRIQGDHELSRLWSCLSADHKKQILEIEAGERVPNLLSDTVFKTIFDPDTQGSRLSDLLSCILGKKVKVLHSLNREGLHDSLYSKGIILDLVVQFEDRSVGHVEIQRYGVRMPPQRAVSYSAELIRRQYAVGKEMSKKEIDYSVVMPVYSIIIMEDSTEEFSHSSYYHHSFSQRSNTDVDIDLLQHYDYICMDKFKQQKPHTAGELERWLEFLSIHEAEEMIHFLCKNKSFQPLYECAIMMTKDREGLMDMIYDLFAEEDIVASLNKTNESLFRMEKERLEKEMLSLSDQKSKLESQNSELESQNSELESQNSELESQNSKLENHKSQLMNHCSELENENERLRQEIEQLKRQLC